MISPRSLFTVIYIIICSLYVNEYGQKNKQNFEFFAIENEFLGGKVRDLVVDDKPVILPAHASRFVHETTIINDLVLRRTVTL